MDPKKSDQSIPVAKSIVESLLNNVLSYCTKTPVNELLSRNKLEPHFQSKAPRIKVMSYNLLANSLTESNLEGSFPHETKYVDFGYRWPLLVKEITSYSPDIACLQEIDKDDDTIITAFQDDYYTFFKSRRGDKGDGCLTMIKKSSMEVIETHHMEFYINDTHPLLAKDNICVISVVAAKNYPGHLFFVGNTHLLFNDNRGDIKTCQIYMAMKALRQLADSTKFKDYNKHFIYCGDFNLIPGSALYDFISRGVMDFSSQKRNRLSGQKLGKISSSKNFDSFYEFLINNTNNYRPNPKSAEDNLNELVTWLIELYRIKVIITHPEDGQPSNIQYELGIADPNAKIDQKFFIVNLPLRMLSAYSTFQRFYYQSRQSNSFNYELYPKYSTFEPLITSCPLESRLTVDYIWFTSDPQQKSQMLRVRSVVETPKPDKMLKYNKFPNRIYPSDHMSLVVEFELV